MSTKDRPRLSAAASALLTWALPMAGGTLLWARFGHDRWINEPLHSSIEVLGAGIALLSASVLQIQSGYEKQDRGFYWVKSALLGMGILDFFHALLPISPGFYWSRTLASLIGGSLFACAWIPGRVLDPAKRRVAPAVCAAALALGACFLFAPGSWPHAFGPEGYTPPAKLINLAGGVTFLAAALHFLLRYRERRGSENLIFGLHCLAFGTAGVLFALSVMWNAVWWFFHGFRLVAYLIVMAYVVQSYRRAYSLLLANHDWMRKKVEEQTRELREALRARDEFLSIASHELKTPLTSLSLQSQMVRRAMEFESEGPLMPERVAKLVEQTEKQTDRLGRLVDDMLDITRIRSGKLAMHPRELDLSELVRDAAERFAPQLGRVELSLAPDALGLWDPLRIDQVLSNLLTNAVRYGRGGPVAVSVERVAGRALLSVRDRGIGIAREHHERIFNRFERAISANEVSGLGLGLYIVRQIVEAHDGRVWVESEPGEGATFHVDLPLRSPAGRAPRMDA